jgi:hexosaminidase
MVRRILILTAIGWTLLNACVQSDRVAELAIGMSWSFDSIDVGTAKSFTTFTLINSGPIELASSEWSIYFNQLSPPGDVITEGSGLHIETIMGDYHSLFPDSTFLPLAPGARRSVQVSYDGFAGRISDAPVGAYFVDGMLNNTSADHIFPIDEDNSFPGLKRKEILEPLLEDVQSRYQENVRIGDIPVNDLSLIPTPVQFNANGQNMTFGSRIAISYADGLDVEANHLRAQLTRVFKGKVTVSENNNGPQIKLSLDETIGDDEAYQLNVANGMIVITGADAAGVFYGIQSLARLYPIASYREPKEFLTIKGCSILDNPRFSYRGLHLDVSRNFHALKYVRKVIDLMAYYKLNKLHLTLTNDEGWRLEIPGLPELTDVGSRRGHTFDERDMLYPAYGSGPFADPDKGMGTGFYTREEFIGLLRYAHDRHIEIIPEIDVPGHARAAIKAMEARYHKYSEAGDHVKANEYLLHDLNDDSEYNSAQNYNDNVICVCQESSYHFIEKVIDEVVLMYREADAPFTAIHSGGDEVPYGAWQKSPICIDWMSESETVKSADDLHSYFLGRLMAILNKYKLTTAGWEEIVLKTSEEGHDGTDINFDFAGKNVVPYVWNSVWGWGREDMAYRLANGGYQLVMCNSGALYFDLAYSRDPAEPGLTWSGYVDTRRAFEFEPLDMFATATTDYNGELLDPAYIEGMLRLNESDEKSILGIQGQLWSETVRNSNNLDYYLFPKLLGLAERAWGQASDWTVPESKNERLEAMDSEWGRFANTVGMVELPRLDYLGNGVAYRIPMPGAVYLGGQLQANIRYPGLEIRYTTDGTEPTASSSLYKGPVRLTSEEIRLRAFNNVGRGGRTSVCY